MNLLQILAVPFYAVSMLLFCRLLYVAVKDENKAGVVIDTIGLIWTLGFLVWSILRLTG